MSLRASANRNESKGRINDRINNDWRISSLPGGRVFRISIVY